MITSFVWTSEDIRKMVRSNRLIYDLAYLDETLDTNAARGELRQTHLRVLGRSKHRPAQSIYQMTKGPRLYEEVIKAGQELGYAR